MAAFAVSSAAAIGDRSGRRRRRARSRWLAAGLGGLLVALMLAFLVREERVVDRVRDDKTVQVVLPPPPVLPPLPVPPPPEPEPVAETPPEPTPAPIDQPIEETPPPEPASDQTPGEDALTAREGAGPTNYGLTRGDGSGRTIGGQPGTGGGGGEFAAYGDRIRLLMQRALQNEREFARGRYTIRLAVAIAPDGHVSDLRMLAGSDDAQRDSAILAFLRNRQFPAPPAGLPTVLLEFTSRPAV